MRRKRAAATAAAAAAAAAAATAAAAGTVAGAGAWAAAVAGGIGRGQMARSIPRLRYLAPTALVAAIVLLTYLPLKVLTFGSRSSTDGGGEAGAHAEDDGVAKWAQVRDFMRTHKCTSAYLDVGSNIGRAVQVDGIKTRVESDVGFSA